MMKNDSAYFKNIFHIGDMYLDHVFFEFEYEPIIFTCTDSNNSLYLCLCSEIRYVQRWIITKTDINILRQLVYKKIDISSAFLMSSELYVVEKNLEGKENSRLVNHDIIDRLDLPKENTFLKCNLSDAENYLNKTSFCFTSTINFNESANKSKEILYNTSEVSTDWGICDYYSSAA